MKNRTSHALPSLFLALLLTGCGGLLTSEQPPRQVYLLQPLAASGSAGDSDATLLFGLAVIPGLDTDRIQALDPDARLVPYANARWPDHLPEVLRSVLSRSLESTGRFDRIESAGMPEPGDWILDLELQAFYGTLDGAGATHSVQAALAGSVSCSDRIVDLQLAASAPVAQERLAAVVAAHQAALDRITRQLIEAMNEGCGDG